MSVLSIDSPNGRVGGLETGDGPPLVLLAGLGSTAAIWGDLPEVLGRHFRVLALDNRGVGGSRSGPAFTFDGAVTDVEAVLDARNAERAAVLGASMGGVIALHAALASPARYSRLVVASSAGHLSSHGRRALELLRDLLLYAPPDRVGAGLMTLAFAPPFHERHRRFVDGTAAIWGLDEADLPGALAQVDHLLEGWDLRPSLGGLELPALVLCGGRDPVVAAEDSAELVEVLPSGELLRLPDAAHSVLAEGGTEILARVTRFLAGDSEPDRPESV